MIAGVPSGACGAARRFTARLWENPSGGLFPSRVWIHCQDAPPAVLFHTSSFLFVFFPITLAAYFALGRWSWRAAIASLALASLLFYGTWSPAYLLLIGAAFIDRCRRHGVQVVAGFPASSTIPAITRRPKRASMTKSSTCVAAKACLCSGTRRFMFPKAMFFDTPYHMNDRGADTMTGLVPARLAEVMRCELSLDWSESRQRGCVSRPYRVMMDLARESVPPGVREITGFSWREPWGRWMDGARASLILDRPLKKPFSVEVVVRHAFLEKVAVQATVRVGAEVRSLPLQAGRLILDFEGAPGVDRIEFELPDQRSPREAGIGSEERRTGLGIARVEIRPRIPSHGDVAPR